MTAKPMKSGTAASSPSQKIVLRPVPQGGDISVEVVGGFARRTAPCDGISVESGDRAYFIPAEKLEEALLKLGRPAPRSSARGK